MSFAQFRTVVSGDFAAKALTAAFVVACVRWLPSAQLAEYVFISALVVLGATLFNGFFNRHYILSDVNPGAARSYRRWQVLASVMSFSVAAALLAAGRPPQTLIAGLCCTAAAAAFDFSRTHAQKNGGFDRYAASELVRCALFLAAAIPILMFAGRHAVWALLAAQAGSYLAAVRLLPALPVSEREQINARALMADRASVGLLVYFALVGVFGQLPMLALERTGAEFELASFGSAMRYYGFALSVVIALNVVLLPRPASTKETLGPLSLWNQSRSMLAAALALLGVIAVAGYLAIPVIDGGKYPDAPLLFLILSCALAPGIVMAPLSNSFLRQRRLFDLIVSLLLSNAVCAAVALLGPHWGALNTPTWAAVSLPTAITSALVYLIVASWRQQQLAARSQ